MRGFCLSVLLLLVAVDVSGQAVDTEPAAFPEFKPYPRSGEFSRSGPQATVYQLGLGALQKVGGRWRHKTADSIDGELLSITWEIDEGYTAEEAMAWMRKQLESAELLFQCEGRSCGSSSQWASRVFEERVLYGHDDRQRYAALRLQQGEQEYSLVLYAVDRANRRHYLRLDMLRHQQPAAATVAEP